MVPKTSMHLCSDTQTLDDGYPLYRRREPEDGGTTTGLSIRQGPQILINKEWVVPHNQILCKIFKDHINVELCSSIKSIKYVCKYINKRSDMATCTIDGNTHIDEIKTYLTGCYISTNEAIWRIFGFEIHSSHPSVINLAIHLENGRVYYTESNTKQIATTPPQTTLTGFFKLCQIDSFAKTLLYQEVPTYYTWKSLEKQRCGKNAPGKEGLRTTNHQARHSYW